MQKRGNGLARKETRKMKKEYKGKRLEKKIQEFDRTVIHYLFTISVSMAVAILTTLALMGKI